jgi:peptidyl-tRNA hydrolase, PTH1 family
VLDRTDRQYVVVGLGNPGREYAMTRHNMGYLVLQALASQQGWNFKEDKQFLSQTAKGKIGDVTVNLLLPLTYMNASGEAVRRFLDYYKLGTQSLIVVTDDVDMPYGQMRVRSIGSPGGHNGLKSIQAHLHSQHYVRLKMGIGRGHPERPLADYVLDVFSAEEKQSLTAFIDSGITVVKRLVSEDVGDVMNSVNVRPKENKSSLP